MNRYRNTHNLTGTVEQVLLFCWCIGLELVVFLCLHFIIRQQRDLNIIALALPIRQVSTTGWIAGWLTKLRYTSANMCSGIFSLPITTATSSIAMVGTHVIILAMKIAANTWARWICSLWNFAMRYFSLVLFFLNKSNVILLLSTCLLWRLLMLSQRIISSQIFTIRVVINGNAPTSTRSMM